MSLENDVLVAVVQGWQHPDNAHKVMDEKLAEAIIANVMKMLAPRELKAHANEVEARQYREAHAHSQQLRATAEKALYALHEQTGVAHPPLRDPTKLIDAYKDKDEYEFRKEEGALQSTYGVAHLFPAIPKTTFQACKCLCHGIKLGMICVHIRPCCDGLKNPPIATAASTPSTPGSPNREVSLPPDC